MLVAQVTGEPMGRIVFEEARGLDGLKEAHLTIKPGDNSPFKMFAGPSGEGITLNIAVANGLGNAKKLIKVCRLHNTPARPGSPSLNPPLLAASWGVVLCMHTRLLAMLVCVYHHSTCTGIGPNCALVLLCCLLQSLQDGTAKYDFIEVMACPGGCIGGGGQPRSTDKQILQVRMMLIACYPAWVLGVQPKIVFMWAGFDATRVRHA